MTMPLQLVAQAIPGLSRRDLAALAERLIDRLDELDGDSDLEGQQDEDGWREGDHPQAVRPF